MQALNKHFEQILVHPGNKKTVPNVSQDGFYIAKTKF
jgi:hypothetical protein